MTLIDLKLYMSKKRINKMDKYSDIISAIRNQQPVDVPGTLVEQVMKRVQKASIPRPETQVQYSIRQSINNYVLENFSGQIKSSKECVFIFLVVGFFYLMAGVVALLGLHDTISRENIHVWLKIQPYITIGNAIYIICSAVVIFYQPHRMSMILYAVLVHTSFIVVNAIILKSILSLQAAFIFMMLLTMLALIFGVLLISAIRSVLTLKLFDKDKDCVENI